MRFRRCAVFAALLLCASVSIANAQSTPTPEPSPTADPCVGPSHLLAVLDRPTIGFSTCAEQTGRALFEIGYQRQKGEGVLDQIQYPQNFLRVGLARHLELDVIGPAYVRTGGQTGMSDAGLGFKYEFSPAGKLQAAIDGLYTGPNGASFLTAGNATETANLDAAYNLSDTVSIGTTLAFGATGGYGANGIHGRYGVFTPSFVVAKQLGDELQLYGEYVSISRVAPDAGARTFVDYGIQQLLGRRIEIDAELGQSLGASAGGPFSYIGVGMGIEIP